MSTTRSLQHIGVANSTQLKARGNGVWLRVKQASNGCRLVTYDRVPLSGPLTKNSGTIRRTQPFAVIMALTLPKQ